MKKICNVLGVIVFILGSIGSVALGYHFGNVVDFTYGGSTYYTRDMVLTMSISLSGFLGTLVIFAILMGIGSILNNQEIITYRIAEIEKRNSLLDEKVTRSSTYNATVKSGEWKCEKCGRINMNTIGTCACGQQRSEQ